jgi:flagellar FliJ protein
MAYQFKYESVLGYRRHLKEKAEIEFSQTKQRLNRAIIELQGYQGNLRQGLSALESGLKKKLSSQELKTHTDYLAGLRSRIAAQEKEVQKWQRILLEKTRNLHTRTKRFKVIERLKEKDLERWKYQQGLAEQKVLAEMSILRHGRDFC